MTFRTVLVASSGASALFQQLLDNIWIILIALCLGALLGLVGGVIYSRYKAKYFSNEAERRIKNIVSDFKKEKDTSESILRELQVGVLAYGADGRLITGNPSANALLGVRDIPQTMQGFLNRYGKDNGISLALMLQTNNVTGNVAVKDRIVRLRITRAQLSMYKTPSWIVIIQDITEQEREDKHRKEFVANVSHELKTPLTTISAYSETLLDWGLEGKTIQEIRSDIARIHDDSNRMDHLVQNLLLLSSIDSRGIRPNMVQYDIVSLMRQVVSRMQIQAQEKNIDLRSSVLSIVPPVFGDPTAIDRILTNLISNAIKYTDHNGRVMVSLQKTDNYISLKVADNGMGVSKENLPRLFDRFYRVDATGSRKYGGTGLGLSIAKELTELQGGTISVSSTLGKGSEFVITIPKAETTYRETMAAILSDSPRTEILFENARNYLMKAAEDIDLPVYELSKITNDQIEDLLSYLLLVTDEEAETAHIRPSGSLPPEGASAPSPIEKNRNEVISGEKDQPDRGSVSAPVEKPKNAQAQGEAERPVYAPVPDRAEKPRIVTPSEAEPEPRKIPVPEPVIRPSYRIEQSQAIRNSDRVAKTIPGKDKVSPREVPIKRNTDVVSAAPIRSDGRDSAKELSDRLTKSKIHPDNRQRLRLSEMQTTIDSLHPRDPVVADINSKEDKREN